MLKFEIFPFRIYNCKFGEMNFYSCFEIFSELTSACIFHTVRNEDTASLHACILDNTLLSEAGKKCNIRLLKRDKNVVCEFVSSQQAYQMSALCGFFANICEKILKIASFVR